MDAVAMMLVLAGAAVAGWCLVLALVVWRLQCRNRVSRMARTSAPLHWLASPARAARLHRRLRAAVATVRLRVPAPARRRRSPGPMGDLADELELEAARLDDQLVLARQAPSTTRRRLLDTLEADVRRVEGLAGRVAALAAASGATAADRWGAANLNHLDQRLGTLEAARAEIDALETAVGLPGPSHPFVGRRAAGHTAPRPGVRRAPKDGAVAPGAATSGDAAPRPAPGTSGHAAPDGVAGGDRVVPSDPAQRQAG